MNKINFQTVSEGTLGKVGEVAAESARTSVLPRILMVGMSITKTRGGISTLIAEILRSDLSNSFEIDYIESQAEDYKGFAKLTLAARAALQSVKNLITKKPEIVYVHVGSNASLYREPLFIILGKLLGKKTIAHFHAGDLDEYLERQPAFGKRFIAWSLGLSDKLIAVSNASAAKLKKLVPNTEIETIPNAIDTRAFAFVPGRLAKRDGMPRILFVGAMGKLKGERDLADAVTILSKKRRDFRVSFLGFGGDQLRIYCREQGIEEFVDFIGAVSLDERLAFFEFSDIFTLPTYAEAMPMSVIEAMAAGLPTVTTPVGGIPELIDNGKEGYLVEPGNPEALAAKLEILLNNREKRVEMGDMARQKVGKELDFGLYTNKLRRAISDLIDNAPRSAKTAGQIDVDHGVSD